MKLLITLASLTCHLIGLKRLGYKLDAKLSGPHEIVTEPPYRKRRYVDGEWEEWPDVMEDTTS